MLVFQRIESGGVLGNTRGIRVRIAEELLGAYPKEMLSPCCRWTRGG